MSLIENHLSILGRSMSSLLFQCDQFVLMSDFNAQPDETSMSNFMESYNFENVTKLVACFKNHGNSFCRDLFLTNRSGCFEDNCIFKAGVSGFQKLAITILRIILRNKNPKL